MGMTLKEELDYIWNNVEIKRPSRLSNWSRGDVHWFNGKEDKK